MPAPTRRTQATRSAETQEALLDATIDCLIDVGYARTTTRMVAERAGVSRGAQTHHYPTKDDLVVAAIEHLVSLLAQRFVVAFEQIPPDRRTLDCAVGELWSLLAGPAYAAMLEVIVAARTDDALRVVLHAVTARLESTVIGVLVQFFPAFAEERAARVLIDLGFTIVQGAALAGYSGYGDPEATIRIVRAAATLLTPETVRLLTAVLDGDITKD